MAVFDVSFLNPNAKRSGGGYGILTDQLSILENSLEVDGKLSPGDYDRLVGEATRIRNHPGLTAEQRSNLDVKISAYGKGKKVSDLKDSSDIARLNREVQDTASTNSMLFANDPQKLLRSHADTLQAKLERLTDSINSFEGAGDDASDHVNEYNETLSRWQDSLQALSDTEAYKSGSAPTSGMAAYIKTNSRGEITGIEIDADGVSKQGYVETNGVYGGLRIYGKARKEGDRKVFKLGDARFSAADISTPDPSNPLGFKANPLVAESSLQVPGGAGSPSIARKGTVYNIDPTKLRVQGYVPANGWAEGDKGTLYQRQSDGKYKKYINADKSALGIDDGDILRVPRFMESSINSSVNETIDGAGNIPLPTPSLPPTPTSSATPSPIPGSLGGGEPRTPSPTERAPRTAGGIAGKALGAAKGFFKGIFGGQ